MKRIGMILAVALFLGLGGVARSGATNLIVNGSFETPSVGGGWSMFSNGTIPGWTTTDPGGQIEIDNSNVVGGPAYDGTQSLEVNAYTPEDVQQTVSGLTVGQQYDLFWAFGDRPGSGAQQMQVTFGGNLVATNVDAFAGSNSTLVWVPQSYVVTATSTTEILSFNGLPDSGSPSYGNEVDAVSLTTTSTPEPSSLLLLGSGLCLLGYGAMRKRSVPAFKKF